MITTVSPSIACETTSGMLGLEATAWTMTTPARSVERVPWKKSESRSRSRNAVPVSQTATASPIETYP